MKHKKKKDKKWKKYLIYTFTAFFRSLSLIDLITDIILLYKASQVASDNTSMMPFVMCLFVSIVAPYILSYSSGVKLFLNRHTFDDLSGFKFVLVVLYLLPTGVIYFILLDGLDILLTYYRWVLFFVFQWSILDIKKLEETLANQIGFER